MGKLTWAQFETDLIQDQGCIWGNKVLCTMWGICIGGWDSLKWVHSEWVSEACYAGIHTDSCHKPLTFLLQVYGSAVIFYEPLEESAITPALLMQLGLQEEDEKNKSVHCNKCIALLSRWPFFDTFKKFLSFLYRVPSSGPHIVPIER